jgi:hypothetical protein
MNNADLVYSPICSAPPPTISEIQEYLGALLEPLLDESTDRNTRENIMKELSRYLKDKVQTYYTIACDANNKTWLCLPLN